MLSRVAREDVGGDLEVRYWRDASQLEEQLAAAMRKHLNLTDGEKAYIPFNASLGLAEDPKENNPVLAESWQILSPVRNHEFGTTEINRKIQAKYRGGMLNYSKGREQGREAIRRAGDRLDRQGDAGDQLPQDLLPEGRGTGLRRQRRDRPRRVRHPRGTARPDSIKVQFSTQPYVVVLLLPVQMSMVNWNSPTP